MKKPSYRNKLEPALSENKEGWKAVEAAAHSRAIDSFVASEERVPFKLVRGGRLIKLGCPRKWQEQQREVTRRGATGAFTRRSRSHMLDTVAHLRRDVVGLFVTLTYPAEWPGDWKVWKSHLNHFAVWLRRKFRFASFVWKLEPQDRGAPHFHLMIFGVPHLPHAVLATAWWNIVGSGCLDHLAAGTSIEAMRSGKGVMWYCAKYIGKEVEGAFVGVGRFWGVVGRGMLPVGQVIEGFTTPYVATQIRRLFRRLRRAAGCRKLKIPVRVYSENPEGLLVRAMDWAWELRNCPF